MNQDERAERIRNGVRWLVTAGAILTAVMSTALAVHVSAEAPVDEAAPRARVAEPQAPAGEVDHSVVRQLHDAGPDPAPGVSIAAYGS